MAPATRGKRLCCTQGDPGGSRHPPVRFGEERGNFQKCSIRALLSVQPPPPQGPPCCQRDQTPNPYPPSVAQSHRRDCFKAPSTLTELVKAGGWRVQAHRQHYLLCPEVAVPLSPRGTGKALDAATKSRLPEANKSAPNTKRQQPEGNTDTKRSPCHT